jgi:hypothetical protein
MNEYYARLKPFDPRREHAMRVFVLGHVRFDQGVWIAVDKPTADTLQEVHQSYYDPLSPAAFEVCTKEEARLRGLIKDAPQGDLAETITPAAVDIDASATTGLTPEALPTFERTSAGASATARASRKARAI